MFDSPEAPGAPDASRPPPASPVSPQQGQGDMILRDPLVDRARAVYLYVTAVISAVQGVVLPLADILGRHVEPLPLSLLAVIAAPAIVYMFGKSAEQALKAWGAKS